MLISLETSHQNRQHCLILKKIPFFLTSRIIRRINDSMDSFLDNLSVDLISRGSDGGRLRRGPTMGYIFGEKNLPTRAQAEGSRTYMSSMGTENLKIE
jgi:hypothetical protein